MDLSEITPYFIKLLMEMKQVPENREVFCGIEVFNVFPS